MSFIFNAPENGAKFATLNPNYAKSDWSWLTLAATLEFSEFRFTSNDDFYFIFANATKLTDFKNFADLKAPWSECLVTFQVARKDYEQYQKAAGGKVTVKQSRLEKVVCMLLAGLDPAVCYSGELCLMDTSTLDNIVSGLDKKGVQMSEEKIAGLLETIGTFEIVEAPEKITDADVGVPAQKNGSGSYSKGQTELEKLNDRLKFLSIHIKVVMPDVAITNVSELTQVLKNASQPEVTEIYLTCLELMK